MKTKIKIIEANPFLGKMTKRMKEMILCLIHQDLNTFPWGLTLNEYFRLKEIREEEEEERRRE